MQDGLIRLIAHGLQCCALFRRGVGKAAQRIVRMQGEDHLIKAFPVPAIGADLRAFGPTHTGHPGPKAQLDAARLKPGLQPTDIFDRPAIDRIPLVMPRGIHELVVAEKSNQRMGRKIENICRRG